MNRSWISVCFFLFLSRFGFLLSLPPRSVCYKKISNSWKLIYTSMVDTSPAAAQPSTSSPAGSETQTTTRSRARLRGRRTPSPSSSKRWTRGREAPRLSNSTRRIGVSWRERRVLRFVADQNNYNIPPTQSCAPIDETYRERGQNNQDNTQFKRSAHALLLCFVMLLLSSCLLPLTGYLSSFAPLV